MFNPAEFLASNVNEAMAERPPLPPGDYIATIGTFHEKSVVQRPRKDGSGITTQLVVRLDIDLTTDPEVASQVGEDKTVVFDRPWLDVTEDGRLDTAKGRNRKLMAYREALGQNIDGEDWNFHMLTGHQVRVKVKHRPDDRNPGKFFEEVEGIAPV